MATHDYNLANQDGASFRSDLNNALAAIVSNNSSSTSPATTFAHQIWVDTTANVIKQRNAANDAWIELWRIDGGFNAKTFSSNITLNAQSDLRFADSDSSNWVAFQAPATVASNVTWTLPSADGTADQALTTNGLGVLSWADAGGTTDNITEGNTSAEVVDTGSDGHFKVVTEGTEALRVTAAQRVGIGTASPNSTLHLSAAQAEVQIQSTSGTNPGYLSFVPGGVSNPWYIYANSSRNFIFEDYSSERMRIDSSGRLLIGTSTARAADFVTGALQIEGTSQNTSSIQLTCNSTASPGTSPVLTFSRSRGSAVGDSNTISNADMFGGLIFTGADGTDIQSIGAAILAYVDGNPGSNDMPGRLSFRTTADGSSSATERARIDSAGRIKFLNLYDNTSATGRTVLVQSTGELVASTSSIKYKTDVETLQDSYADAVLQIRPVWYKSLCTTDNPDWGWWGFIAEEVAEIDPRLVQWKESEVTHDENGAAVVTELATPEPEGVYYERFVPHLLNLIKRQKKQLESQAASIAALETANASLEARLTALENA